MYPPPARRTVIEDESINISRDSSFSSSSFSFSSVLLLVDYVE